MGGVAWTEEEDHLLRKCIKQYGEGKWHRVPLLAGLNRCRKSCRLRWLNYLRPNIKRGSFIQEEIDLIIKLHMLLGNRWSLIASRLPGRTANDVKNYWNCHLSKRLDAQETEEKQISRKEEPENTETSPRSLEGPSYLQPQDPNVETCTKSTPLTPIQHPEDGREAQQALQSVEEHGFFGDLDLDVGFDHDNFRSIYDWDDLILDNGFFN